MVLSLAIVAGHAAAVPEVVDEGVTAFLFNPDDVALAEILVKLLEEPAMRHALGSAGRARVHQYNAPVVARQFLAAIGIASM